MMRNQEEEFVSGENKERPGWVFVDEAWMDKVWLERGEEAGLKFGGRIGRLLPLALEATQ